MSWPKPGMSVATPHSIGPHVEDLGDERVARLGAPHGDRPGRAVDPREVDLGDEVVLAADLAGEAVVRLERDDVAGLDLQHRLEVRPERPDDLVARDSVLRHRQSPGRRVVRPAAAEHRRHDLHLAQLLRLARERVAVEHDEVGVAAGDERPAHALVVREPGGRDAHRVERLLEREALILAPVVEDGGDDAGPRLELLDRRVGAVREQRARLEERAERVRRRRGGRPRSASRAARRRARA